RRAACRSRRGRASESPRGTRRAFSPGLRFSLGGVGGLAGFFPFFVPPPLLGGLFFSALPPGPGHIFSPRGAAPSAAADAKALHEAGFDLVMLENFGDAPFFAGRVPAITVSAMTACAVAAREACTDLPLGINVLRNDADAALAIAAVIGAACIR